MVHVKQEPPLLPGLDPPASLGQEARAASRCQPQVRAAGHPMTQRLHVDPEVKVCGEEEGQAALLQRQMEKIESKSPFSGKPGDIISFQWPFVLHWFSDRAFFDQMTRQWTHLSDLKRFFNLFLYMNSSVYCTLPFPGFLYCAKHWMDFDISGINQWKL